MNGGIRNQTQGYNSRGDFEPRPRRFRSLVEAVLERQRLEREARLADPDSLESLPGPEEWEPGTRGGNTPKDDAAIRRMVEWGWTATDIAQELHRNLSSLYRALRRLGLKAESEHGAERFSEKKSVPLERIESIKRMHANGKTDSEMALIAHLSVREVNYVRRKLGLPNNFRTQGRSDFRPKKARSA
jgi:hypothetical protein